MLRPSVPETLAGKCQWDGPTIFEPLLLWRVVIIKHRLMFDSGRPAGVVIDPAEEVLYLWQ